MTYPPRVAIGIQVRADLAQLRATLDSIRMWTRVSTALLFLPDGPDAATAAALQTWKDIPQLGTTQPLGPPACFNRLASATDADVLVLLASGSIVSPEWLDRLLAALYADARNGLAGPSTNRAWNEQCVFPCASEDPSRMPDYAEQALQRYGSRWRTLEPLHSLADFCYVVRREVLLTVGAADEGYGLGPCWEMDYNIRAARAGWRGVWACAAVVFRSPLTEGGAREEESR